MTSFKRFLFASICLGISVFVSQSEAAKPSSVVFIDSSIAGWQVLAKAVRSGTETVVLNPRRDELAQMASALKEMHELRSISLISHGAPGALILGHKRIDSHVLVNDTVFTGILRKSLRRDGALLLYGCSIAHGKAGDVFLRRLARMTHCRVAGSSDATGARFLGGDWVLEKSVGGAVSEANLNPVFLDRFSSILATPSDNTTTFGTGGNDVPLASGAGNAGVSASNVRGTGWDIKVFTTNSTVINIAAGNLYFGTGDGIYYSPNSGYPEPLSSFTVTSNDGSIFDLKSFDFSATDMTNTATMLYFTVTGYRNGSPVSGATANFALTSSGGAWPLGTEDVSSNANFDGIDSFVITKASGSDIGFFAIDNLNVANVRQPNAAPVLSTDTRSLTAINEDATSNSGTMVSTFLASAGTATDSNGDTLGIAVTGGTSSNGTYEYSSDGASWYAMGSLSDNSAVLLAPTNYIRFVPNSNYNGTDTGLTFRAWDQTSGSAGLKVDVSTNGGSTAFSSASATGRIVVYAVNDAPVLTPYSPMLTGINEDATANGGDLVSSFLGSSVSDVDSGAMQGIAVTSQVSGNGSWQYSIDSGSTWSAVGTVSGSSALLLRATDKVRFVPDAKNGTTASFTYRAWDQTSGTAGTKADALTNGGTTAFSIATDTASITVSSVNDAPVITSNGGGATAAVNVPENSTAVTTVTSTDVDTGDTATYSITGGADAALFSINAGTGMLMFNSAPNYEAPTDANSDGVYEVTVQVTDSGGLTDSQAISVTVTNVNEPPVITSNGGGATAAVNVPENSTAVTTVTAIDPDAGDTPTFSITGGADAALFSINASTGVLTLNSAPNYETPIDANSDGVYQVTVQAADGHGGTDSQAISVTVSNVNEAPTDIALSATSVHQSGGTNATIGTLSATDPDANDTAAFTLVSGTGSTDNADFNISGDQLRANDASTLTAGKSYSVRIRVTDSGGLTYEKVFTLSVIDDIAPTITGVTSSKPNGTYKAGDTIPLQVTFSEAVTVTGTPALTLATGTTNRKAVYASGSGSSVLTFNYTVQSSDQSNDLDYVSASALSISGASISDSSANAATLTLAAPGAAGSLGANKNLVIDGATETPLLTNPAANGADNASLAVDFSLPEAASSGTVKLTFTRTGGNADTGSPHVIVFGSADETPGAHSVTLDGATLGTASSVASVSGGTALVDGAIYDVKLEYADVAGNSPASVTHSNVTYDSTTQDPTLTTPASGSSDNHAFDIAFSLPETAMSGTVTLTFANTGGAADANAPHVLTLNSNFESAGAHALALDGTNLSSSTGVAQVSSDPNDSLVDGAQYSVTLSYQDALGNPSASAQSTNVTYDNSTGVPSTPDLAAASDTGNSDTDNVTRDATPTFTGTAEAGGTVSVLVDGNSAGTATVDSNGGWSFTVSSALSNGSHSVTAEATDKVGNVSAPSAALTITIDTTAPAISSAGIASGTYGSAFSSLVTASGGAVSFSASNLPGGLSIDPSSGTISGTPTAAGSFNATVGATDIAGNTATAALSISIAKATQTVTFAPIASASVGTPVTLSASSSSGLPVTFSLVSGDATLSGSSLTVNSAQTAVTVRATQVGDTNHDAASADQTVGSVSKLSQTITFTQPADHSTQDAPFAISATAISGLAVTFTLQSGPATLSGSTLTLSGAPGTVTVVAHQAGNNTYDAATDVTRSFQVTAPGSLTGMGSLSNGSTTTGSFAVHLAADGHSGVLIGYVPGHGGFVLDFAPDANGAFSATTQPIIMTQSTANDKMAAAPAYWTFHGQIQGNSVSGSISELSSNFAVSFDPVSGPTASISGYYQTPSLNTASDKVHTIIGTNGDVYVLAAMSTLVDAGSGSVNSSTGTFSVQSSSGATVDGTADASTGTMAADVVQPTTGTTTTFAGTKQSVARTDRLINLSSRGEVGSGNDVIITGFVIGGTAPKEVLVRAVGPSLKPYGVSDPLADPNITIMHNGAPVAQNDNWSDASNASAIADAMLRTGAFGIDPGSKDAAILTTLQPGVYTAVVRGNGTPGVALAEVYDASADPSTEYQRLVNISTRAMVGSGDNILIGGFVVSGNSPKRVLVRGVGPKLADMGISNFLPDPKVAIYHGSTVVAQNNDWGTGDNTATELADAATATGAFALNAGSKDAAILITLAPGAYTVHVMSNDSSSGIALMEVYEVP